jgi:photosystem II stability/assembly factor-like uncharacterized protein
MGTTEGVFVAEAGHAARATDLTDRRVHALRQVDGQLLAGTADGVYRSGADAAAWQRIGLDNLEVLELCIAPGDARLMLAGTRPAGLFRSRDGGESWSEVESFARAFDPDTLGLPVPSWPPGARAHTIIVDADNPRHYMVGVEVGGIVITEDDGATWSTVMPGGDPDIHCIVADPTQPRTLYASTGFGRVGRLADEPEEQRIAGMFASDDGGRSWRFVWEAMHRQYTRPLCIDPRAPNAVTVCTAPSARPYITHRLEGGAQGRLFQSTDRGVTWRELGDDQHAPSVAALLCVTPADDGPGNVLIGTDQGEVWHVSSGDRRWTRLVDGLPPVQAVHAAATTASELTYSSLRPATRSVQAPAASSNVSGPTDSTGHVRTRDNRR